MKYLGIDYGKKKIGLAISEGISASTLPVLDVTSLTDALNKVSHIIDKENITEVVIGISESGESYKMTKSFIQALQERNPQLKIIAVPETLSTQRAKDRMIEFGTSKKTRIKDDSVSAVIILEDYLLDNRQ